MKNATLITFGLLAGLLGTQAPAFSAQPADQDFRALGPPLPAAALKAAHARGELVVSATSNGNVSGNTVSGNSVTGGIADTQSIQNNTGFTTVLQNTGNNALLQSSTAIYLSAN